MRQTVDRQISRIAHRQGGHIKHAQLRALGLGEGAIRYRIKIGRLIPVYHEVYAVAHLPTNPLDYAQGALLAGGDRAALCDLSAGWVWEMVPVWETPIHITLPVDRRPSGLITHLAKLTPADLRHHRGVTLTSPARTALEIAPKLTKQRVRRMINDARHHRYARLTEEQIADVVIRFPRHRGAKLLRPFANLGRGATRSELEELLQRFIDHFGFPQPLICHPIGPYEIDAYFPAERVAVEVDGWPFHNSRDAFEHDRLRDAYLLAEYGIVTVRITYHRLTKLASAEARRLDKILRARR